jgi:hypothetical protein
MNMKTTRNPESDSAAPDAHRRQAAQADPAVPSQRRLARTAGVLYLLVGILGGFAIGFVYPKVYVAGDAAATARNVAANGGLLRAGIAADLVQAVLWVLLALTFHRLLKHVGRNAAASMVILTAMGASVTCLNTVFEFEGLRVASDSLYATALGTAGSSTLVLLLLDLHNIGLFGIEQIFFGLWLIPLGYLVYRSGLFPRALGVLLIIAGICYLADAFGLFLAPALREALHAVVVAPVTALAEIWMLGYLLVKGVRNSPRVAPA